MSKFSRTHQHGTLIADPAAEKLLKQTLTQLYADIGELPESIWLESLWLGGGYGRGEGGVLIDERGSHLYNDLDFFVLTCGTRKQAGLLNAALKRISKTYHEKLGIDVDFEPARTLMQLESTSETLMTQEMIHGHVIVYGEDVPQQITRIEADQIHNREGLRLLLNRGTGLLLAALEMHRQHPDQDFVRRNLNKAALGIGDAWLIFNHSYAWSVKTRAERLPERYHLCYSEALEFKARPTHTPEPDPEGRWKALVALWQGCLRECLDGKKPDDWMGSRSLRHLARVLVRLHQWPRHPGRNPLADELEQLQVLLQQPLEALTEANCNAQAYLKQWRVFN